jgi:hypothetical protein
MRSLLLLLTVTAHAATVYAQVPTAQSEPLMHAETAFSLVVHLPYSETAPLFGPEGERAWGGNIGTPSSFTRSPQAMSRALSSP